MGGLLTNMSPERPETPDMPDIGPAGVSGAAMAGADTSSSSLKSPAPAHREGGEDRGDGGAGERGQVSGPSFTSSRSSIGASFSESELKRLSGPSSRLLCEAMGGPGRPSVLAAPEEEERAPASRGVGQTTCSRLAAAAADTPLVSFATRSCAPELAAEPEPEARSRAGGMGKNGGKGADLGGDVLHPRV